MSRPSLRVLSITVIILILIVAVGIYYFFYRSPEPTLPNVVVMQKYACADESFYFVVEREDAIEVAGARYEQVPSDSGARYESDRPLAFTIAQDTLTVEDRTVGTVVATCERIRQEEAPPLFEARSQQ